MLKNFKTLSMAALAALVMMVQVANAEDCTLGEPTGGDDTPQLLEALQKCGTGGMVTIPSGEYQLLTPLEVDGLDNVIINLVGNLALPKSMDDQKAAGTDNWIWLEGKGVTLKGDADGDGGHILGNGQEWYDAKQLDDRFALLGIRLEDSVITNIKLDEPCNNFFNVRNCVNVNFTDLTLTAESATENPPKNTDGFDLHDSTQLHFSHVDIYNQDDCIAFKNGTTFVTAEDVYCKGGHGFSVGSLGKGADYNVVSDISMTRMTCEDCWAVAQIKFYPAGSSGYVKNFFATDFTVTNVKLPIWIHSHYPCNPEEYTEDGGCDGYPGPSLIEVSNMRFSGFTGSTTGSYDNNVVIFDCPYGTPCSEIYVEDMDVSPPEGNATYVCNNINDSNDIGIDCEITSGPLVSW
ncbi:pectin lyase fold/virulence factor [Zychaea mexicana]|uniref:pectin lyase fold/virulence factor n=1 Tax=Zychaea mexicana TaxID=64656 RepID=UPI0022FDD55F|nr:pectin lyase fold/virulence factor [Zychaea mexicana]KAI9495476.1 pectin lyase fold/virulence factor [Zychaea mexicana]